MGQETTQRILEIQVNNDKAIESIVRQRNAIEQLKKEQEQWKEDLKNGNMNQQDFATKMEASNAVIVNNKKNIQALSKEIQNNIKTSNEQEGSLAALRAKLSNTTKAYDELSRSERESAKGKDLLESLNAITTELKAAEEESQRFYRNVGNYPDAIKPLKTQLKELTGILAQMKLEGKDNTQEFQDMMKQAGELKDTMGDVKSQINAFSSDTASLDTATQGVETLMQSYMMWQMASQELGIENKELDDVMRTIMGSLSVLNAITMIANSLQAESALMKGVTAAKTWILNTATAAQATATAASAVATGTATSAQIAFNAAVYANPIAWLVGLVVGAVAAIYGLIKAVQWFCSASADQKETLRKEGEMLERNIEINKRALEIMKAKGMSDQQILNETMKIRRKELSEQEAHFKKAEQLYDEDSDEYKAAQESKMNAMEAFRASLNEGMDSLYKLQAQANDRRLKDSMTDLQYATHKANMEMKDQYKTMFLLKNAGKLTADQVKDLSATIKQMYKYSVEDAKKAEAEAAKKGSGSNKGSSKTKAEIAKEAGDKEQEAMREAEDALLELIKDGAEKQRKEINLKYDRDIEDLKSKLSTEKNLTAKAREAINTQITALDQKRSQDLQKISEDEIKNQIEKEQKRIELILASVKAGSDQEYQLKMEALAKQKEAELANTKLTEEEKQLIKNKYAAQEDQLTDQHLNDINKKQSDALKLDWENKINEAHLNNQNVLQLELDQKQAELDNLHQLEGESNAEFSSREITAKQAVVDKKKAINDYEVSIEQAKMTAIGDITGALSGLLEEAGEHSRALAKAGKVLALAEIAINTGKAIAAGTAQAMSVPFPGNLVAIATTVGTVIANVTSAIKTVKSAKFATGGLVRGSGSGTSDSIPAMLSNGESVMTERATSMFAPILSSFNQIGGGVPLTVQQSSSSIMGEDMLARAVAKGVQAMPSPVVSVKEINDVSSRVKIVENLGNV